MTKNNAFLACLASFSFLIHAPILAKTTLSSTRVDDNTQTISLTLQLAPKDFVLKESIDISVDHPDINLSHWRADRDAVERY